jgi:glycosyltransferase involved in cell wall biosynthesis
MRIGFALLTLFPRRVGGAETYVQGLLGQYASGAGPEEVVVLANRHVMARYRNFARGPVSLRHVDSYRPGDGTVTRALAMAAAALAPARAARAVPVGLELVHYAVTVPIPATDARRVVTLHDVQHHDLPHLFPRAERAYRRWAYDGSARKADVVVTSSGYSKERIVTLLDIPAERVQSVPFGIDHTRFAPEPQLGEEQALAGLDLPARFALYPANLWPHKNHGRLLEALALLPDRELGLVLTGEGYGRLDRLLRRARELGLEGRVRHLGHVAPEILPALYRRATLLAFPSLYEGFGAPPLEAMACGCPVAASNRTSIPEVCGQAALPFEPHSAESIAGALARATSDEELRARLRSAGLERARAFTWEASAERHAKIYARVTAT